MNLKQLEIFVAVAETGSFSRGAELTYLTQSTVSQHISALETEAGIKLLDRTGRGALLTDGGKILLHHAHLVLSGVSEAERALKNYRGMTDIHLQVGCSTLPSDYLIPQALPLLFQRIPGLKLTVPRGDSSDILAMLAREDISLGVVGCRFPLDGIDFLPLCHDEIVLIVPPTHRWRGGSPLTVHQLADEPFIDREPGSGTAKTVAEALTGAGVDLRQVTVRARLGSGEAVKKAVAGGLGIAFVSERSVRGEVERNELAVVPIPGLTISRKIYLATRGGRELSPAACTFMASMQELFNGA
jgi:DNA-binding transcriptional LysR family regulator